MEAFEYMRGDDKVRVPRGLVVNLPDDVAAKAIAEGNAVSVSGEAPRAPAKKLAEDHDGKKHAGKVEHEPVKGKHDR